MNGTYYVVEAVADSADKKLHVVSAYMSNKKASGGVNQELNMENASPQPTPEAQLDPVASAQSNNNLTQPPSPVKFGRARRPRAGARRRRKDGQSDLSLGDKRKHTLGR